MPGPSTMWGTALTTQFTNPASFHINLAAESCWREANFEGKERMRHWGRKLSGEQHSGIHWVPLDIRRGLGVSAEVHGGLWRPLWDPSCSPRAHSSFWHVHFPSRRGLMSLSTRYLDTWCNHFSPLCYIWRYNLAHVESGSVQYREICYNRANRCKNVRMTWQALWVFLSGQ